MMLFSKKQYPVFEIGTIVSFEYLLRTLYGKVVGLNTYNKYSRELGEKGPAQWSKRDIEEYFKGKYVVVLDSDSRLYEHLATDLYRVENPKEIIESLRRVQERERERGVPVDSQIYFLENASGRQIGL